MERYLGEQSDLEGEIWKPLPFNNDYFISSKGRVRSKNFVIKPQVNKKTGIHQAMTYTNEKKPKLINIHTWVGRMFLKPPKEEGMRIRHITKDFSDNSISNIRWAFFDIKKNIEHGIYIQGHEPEKKVRYHYVIKQITLTGLVIGTYVGFDMLESMGFKRASIMQASKGIYNNSKDIYKSHRWEVIKTKIIDNND